MLLTNFQENYFHLTFFKGLQGRNLAKKGKKVRSYTSAWAPFENARCPGIKKRAKSGNSSTNKQFDLSTKLKDSHNFKKAP